MGQNRELATKIFDHLVEKGAGIGNVSIMLIESVLDKESLKQYEYTGQDVIIVVQAHNDKQAYQFFRDKLQEEDLEYDDHDIGVDQFMNITSNEPGVITFIDNRSAF